MRVIPIACLSDNYAYLVVADGSKEAVVVDPSEAEPVVAALEREGLSLVGILATHHHFDHVGGNDALLAKFGTLPVYGSQYDFDEKRVPGQTIAVKDGSTFDIAGLSFRCLYVPGHTLGAIAYVVNDAVFTGDTMFVAGCGRLFEGTPDMMVVSLCDQIGKLPGHTRMYCGHEYTVSNLRFAAAAEPENEDVKRKLEVAQENVLATNPRFLRRSPKNWRRIPSYGSNSRQFKRIIREAIVAKFWAKCARPKTCFVNSIFWKSAFPQPLRPSVPS